MITILRVVPASAEQWDVVIEGMRNSWESWERSDSYIDRDGLFVFGVNDQGLARRLLRLGGDHGKWARQIPLHIVVRAPEFWWKEFDTYRAGVCQEGLDLAIQDTDITQNSTSMMHTLGKQPISEDLFSMEDMREDDRLQLLDLMERLRLEWVDAGKRKPSREWRALNQAVAQSWLYTRTVSMNLQVAWSIYHARRHHRLTEWHRLCEAVTQGRYGTVILPE